MPSRRTTPTLDHRRSLARQIELVIDPRSAARRGYARTPCIPYANRTAVYWTLRRAIEMLCDETLVLADASLDRLAELSLSPRSALYQPHHNRARSWSKRRWIASAKRLSCARLLLRDD